MEHTLSFVSSQNQLQKMFHDVSVTMKPLLCTSRDVPLTTSMCAQRNRSLPETLIHGSARKPRINAGKDCDVECYRRGKDFSNVAWSTLTIHWSWPTLANPTLASRVWPALDRVWPNRLWPALVFKWYCRLWPKPTLAKPTLAKPTSTCVCVCLCVFVCVCVCL